MENAVLEKKKRDGKKRKRDSYEMKVNAFLEIKCTAYSNMYTQCLHSSVCLCSNRGVTFYIHCTV